MLDRFLRPESRRRVGATGYFCPFASCDAAYFDDFERVALVDQLALPAYPKDRGAPICACFELGTDEIERDLAEGVVTRVKSLVARAGSEEARCGELAANGRSCVADVQRYYMQRRPT